MVLDLSKACHRAAKKNRMLSGQGGIATGTVMLIAFLMSAIAYGVLALSSTISVRDLKYLYFQNSLEIIHTNIYAFGQNERAFQATLNLNVGKGRMDCIKNGPDCSTPVYDQGNSAFEKVALAYPDGSLYYDVGTSSKNGFGLDGRPCAFNASQVVNGCVLQLDIRWTPFCNNIDCTIALNKSGRLIFMFYYKMPNTYKIKGGISYDIRNYLPVEASHYNGPMRIIMNPYR